MAKYMLLKDFPLSEVNMQTVNGFKLFFSCQCVPQCWLPKSAFQFTVSFVYVAGWKSDLQAGDVDVQEPNICQQKLMSLSLAFELTMPLWISSAKSLPMFIISVRMTTYLEILENLESGEWEMGWGNGR